MRVRQALLVIGVWQTVLGVAKCGGRDVASCNGDIRDVMKCGNGMDLQCVLGFWPNVL